MKNFKNTLFAFLATGLLLSTNMSQSHIVTLDKLTITVAGNTAEVILCGDMHAGIKTLDENNERFFTKLIHNVYGNYKKCTIKFSMEHVIGLRQRICVSEIVSSEQCAKYQNIDASYPDIRELEIAASINMLKKVTNDIQPFAKKYFDQEFESLSPFEEALGKEETFENMDKLYDKKKEITKKVSKKTTLNQNLFFNFDNIDGFPSIKQHINLPHTNSKALLKQIKQYIKTLTKRNSKLNGLKNEQEIINTVIEKIKNSYGELKEAFKRKRNYEKDSYSEVILGLVQQEKSFDPLKRFHKQIFEGLIETVADASFLLDIIESVKNGYKKIIVIAGAAHTRNIRRVLLEENQKQFKTCLKYGNLDTFETNVLLTQQPITEEQFIKAFNVGPRKCSYCKKELSVDTPYFTGPSGTNFFCPKCRERLLKKKKKKERLEKLKNEKEKKE